tara:strand:- start:10742 stop:11146 length:405 start_codon:yes stop_codon:yes gene_type:complete
MDAAEDAKFTKRKRDSSNNSGETYYRSTDKLDINEYSRDGNAVVEDRQGGSIADAIATVKPTRQGVLYSSTKRAIGTSAHGDRQPEAPVRKDNDSAALSSANAKRFGGSKRSTILTSSRGTLGSTPTTKTLLGG